MSEKHLLPTAVEPVKASCWRSRLPWLALVALLYPAQHLLTGAEHQLKCPSQPDPLYPPEIWTLNKEEQDKSTALLQVAVVSMLTSTLTVANPHPKLRR
jgi:hypothetical protein